MAAKNGTNYIGHSKTINPDKFVWFSMVSHLVLLSEIQNGQRNPAKQLYINIFSFIRKMDQLSGTIWKNEPEIEWYKPFENQMYDWFANVIQFLAIWLSDTFENRTSPVFGWWLFANMKSIPGVRLSDPHVIRMVHAWRLAHLHLKQDLFKVLWT